MKRNSGGTRAIVEAASGIAIALALMTAGSAPAYAVRGAAAPPSKSGASTPEDADAPGALQDEDIVVSGQRPRGAPATDVKPEVSINSNVIQALGAVDLTEVFNELSAEIGTAPKSWDSRNAVPIILVNGQRIAGFSSIKDFPPEAVARIDVFPDKVALQYGYGPTQKVVNVVLRQKYHALTLMGRYTLAPESWRGIYRAKVDLLRIGETSHWNVALDYSHQDAIFSGTTVTTTPPPPGTDGVVPRHTLAAQNDHLTISGLENRMIGTVNAELTGDLELDTLQSRPGLAAGDLALLDQEGLDSLASGPFDRLDRSVQARTNLTLNGKAGGWRWSFTGRLDESTRETETQSAFDERAIHVIIPSPGLLGDRCGPSDVGCVSTTTRRAGGDWYLNGDLFALPAGAITTAFHAGAAATGVRSNSAQQATELSREEGDVGVNVDVPITPANSAIGKLTVGVNGDVRRLSDFDTLTTWGSTLDWSPTRRLDILATFSRTEQAPTLVQLGQATLTTPDQREFDFVSGATTLITRSEGGYSSLTPSTSRIAKLRAQLTPFPTNNITLSAEYTLEHTRNPIINLTAVTSAALAAFPGRFTRANGYLTSMDTAALNAFRHDSQQIRWGATYSAPFGREWPSGGNHRDQFQIALYDTWHFQDQVVLRQGQNRLDLLDGDLVSEDGGTPAHRVELQTSVTTRGLGVDVSGVWQTPTTAYTGTGDRLTFTQGVTVNLRVQINLAYQHWLTRLIPILKGSLNLSADNILGAHLGVRNQAGITPSAYSEDYINPTGRTFRITLRKRFR